MRIESSNSVNYTQRTGTTKTQPLSETTKKAQTTVLSDQVKIENTPQAKSTAEVAAAAKAAKAEQVVQMGNKIVDGARSLHTNGYTYPPDLGANYRHVSGKIGCCADFVCDSYKQAGFSIGQDMESKGFNPHYCPSMIKYFQDNQTLLQPNAKAQVGDAVFFDWNGNGAADPDHVAVVTKVDDQGRPIELMESRKFNQPTEVTTLNWNPPDSRASKIVGYGRLKDATADNAAANLLPPLPSTGSGGGGGGGSSSSSAAGSSNRNSGLNDPGSATRTTGKSTGYIPPKTALMILNMILQAIGLDPATVGDEEAMAQFAAELAKNPNANVQELAKKFGLNIPADKLDAFKQQVTAHAGDLMEAGKVAEAASADTAKWLGKLSANDIEGILNQRGSPLAGQGMGDFILQMEKKYGVPAAQFLAMGTMESNLGQTGYTQGENHNIGNIRPGSSWEGNTVSGSAGEFRSYDTAQEGIEDYFKLLSGPLYAGKTLADQINTYAPPSENDTNNYINTVVNLIDGWTS